GWDLVVIARNGLGRLETPELHRQYGKLWKRLLSNRPRTESPADAPGVADGTHA
ncbi:ribonuclease P protein component, partial [Pseudomonas aeruginosa]